MATETEFRNYILRNMMECSYNETQVNNFDAHRFANVDGNMPYMIHSQFAYLEFFLNNYGRIFKFYEALQDKESKDLLTILILYRLLGHLKIKLPRNNPEFWQLLEQAKNLPFSESKMKTQGSLSKYYHTEIEFNGKKVKVDLNPHGILYSFLVKQYFFNRNGVTIQPEKGDYVIDAGTCTGSNALPFAIAVGETGKVFGFDFMPAHIEAVDYHLQQNPEIAKIFKLFPVALADKPFTPATAMLINTNNVAAPAASLMNPEFEKVTPTESIDNLVQTGQIEKVDFIKMDIEGYELKALKGAKSTIKKFKPKLAISIYHKPEDFFEIPDFIRNLNLGYKMYLDHHTIYQEETVLYAIT